ncbi:hypothetical protein ON010_g8202 [Phytophthora cinnamomi]|nr:hypothetical protein ON010_g8202 [Phytophthora cinnamomi]
MVCQNMSLKSRRAAGASAQYSTFTLCGGGVAHFDNLNDVLSECHLARLSGYDLVHLHLRSCGSAKLMRRASIILRQALATKYIPVVSSTFGNTGTFLVFFDGGARGNPGPGGSGAIVVRVGSSIANMEVCWMCDDYPAAATRTPPRATRLKSIHWQCRRLADTLGIISWHHHAREFNKAAGALANIAMDTKKSAQRAPHIVRHDHPKWETTAMLSHSDVGHWIARNWNEDPLGPIYHRCDGGGPRLMEEDQLLLTEQLAI